MKMHTVRKTSSFLNSSICVFKKAKLLFTDFPKKICGVCVREKKRDENKKKKEQENTRNIFFPTRWCNAATKKSDKRNNNENNDTNKERDSV